MMKIDDKVLFIGDLHIGARNDNQTFYDYFRNVYKKFIFPLIKQEGIKHVVQLGDTLDRRKYINFLTSEFARNEWFQWFHDNKVHIHSLAGNHDLYYRNSSAVCGLDNINVSREFCHIYTTPTWLKSESGKKLLLVPWICDDNMTSCLEEINKSDRDTVIAGHFQLAGFQMYRGSTSENGTIDVSALKNAARVISGHYHTHSENENICYLGTPYEITWQDCNDAKYVGLYKFHEDSLEFIQQPFKMFHKIFWHDDILEKIRYKDYSGGYIRVYTDSNVDQKSLDELVSKLDRYAKPIDISIIETNVSAESATDLESVVDDPLTVLIRTIDTSEGISEEKKLKALQLARNLYAESLRIGAQD